MPHGKIMFGSSGHFLWVLMEYCAHGTLTSQIGDSLDDPARQIQWAEQLLLGLQHMHCLNVIHRDIKTVRQLLPHDHATREAQKTHRYCDPMHAGQYFDRGRTSQNQNVQVYRLWIRGRDHLRLTYHGWKACWHSGLYGAGNRPKAAL